MIISGPQQGWQCPLCRNIYAPTTPMCYSCSNQHNKYTTDTTSNSKITTSIGVDFDPNKLSTTTGIRLTNTSNESNTVYINQVFPDNPTEGHNINWPYEV